MGLVKNPDYDRVTKLYREMEICSEFLHCTHQEFEELPFEEKIKWYSYTEMRVSRQGHTDKKERLKKEHRDTHMAKTMQSKKVWSDKGRVRK